MATNFESNPISNIWMNPLSINFWEKRRSRIFNLVEFSSLDEVSRKKRNLEAEFKSW